MALRPNPQTGLLEFYQDAKGSDGAIQLSDGNTNLKEETNLRFTDDCLRLNTNTQLIESPNLETDPATWVNAITLPSGITYDSVNDRIICGPTTGKLIDINTQIESGSTYLFEIGRYKDSGGGGQGIYINTTSLGNVSGVSDEIGYYVERFEYTATVTENVQIGTTGPFNNGASYIDRISIVKLGTQSCIEAKSIHLDVPDLSESSEGANAAISLGTNKELWHNGNFSLIEYQKVFGSVPFAWLNFTQSTDTIQLSGRNALNLNLYTGNGNPNVSLKMAEDDGTNGFEILYDGSANDVIFKTRQDDVDYTFLTIDRQSNDATYDHEEYRIKVESNEHGSITFSGSNTDAWSTVTTITGVTSGATAQVINASGTQSGIVDLRNISGTSFINGESFTTNGAKTGIIDLFEEKAHSIIFDNSGEGASDKLLFGVPLGLLEWASNLSQYTFWCGTNEDVDIVANNNAGVRMVRDYNRETDFSNASLANKVFRIGWNGGTIDFTANQVNFIKINDNVQDEIIYIDNNEIAFNRNGGNVDFCAFKQDLTEWIAHDSGADSLNLNATTMILTAPTVEINGQLDAQKGFKRSAYRTTSTTESVDCSLYGGVIINNDGCEVTFTNATDMQTMRVISRVNNFTLKGTYRSQITQTTPLQTDVVFDQNDGNGASFELVYMATEGEWSL